MNNRKGKHNQSGVSSVFSNLSYFHWLRCLYAFNINNIFGEARRLLFESSVHQAKSELSKKIRTITNTKIAYESWPLALAWPFVADNPCKLEAKDKAWFVYGLSPCINGDLW